MPDSQSDYRIERAVSGSTNWQVLATNQTASSWIDNAVTAGVRYDYRLLTTSGALIQVPITAATEAAPYAARGHLLLVVESALATGLGASLDGYIGDLAGDGWKVVAKRDAPRHHDVWDSFDAVNVANLKNWIVTNAQAYGDVERIVMLGHVVVPYSGSFASDGHGDHQVAWAADAYYGDISGPPWTVGQDGKFTNDVIPSTLDIPVGRIDLGHLPVFGTDTVTTGAPEIALVLQYLLKDHRYRFEYLYPDLGVFLNYLSASGALKNGPIAAQSFWGDHLTKLDIADPFRDNSSVRFITPVIPYKWAFVDGAGHSDAIYYYIGQERRRYTSTLIRDNQEPPIAFWTVQGSYFADFNFADDFVRCIIAKPSYGLVVLPSSDALGEPWFNFNKMALGDDIAASFLWSINYRYPNVAYRWVNIVGDPTMRQNTLRPPTITQHSRDPYTGIVTVSWNQNDGATRAYVYRASTAAGAVGFDLLSTNNAAPWTYTTPVGDPVTNRLYMVRSAKVVPTGRGSYWNLSQGVSVVP